MKNMIFIKAFRSLDAGTVKSQNKKKELGASLVEYGLLVALVAVIAIPSIRILGQSLDARFEEANNKLGAGNVPGDY
jgi:Flp pilus assembly pilin Flp